MKIKITCKGSKYIPISKLTAFQGNLKELRETEFEKLKDSILKYGFAFPVFVWKNFILDGHQRIFTVKKLIEEGHSIDNIPVVEIEAKTKKEAAEKLLLINSRYARITDEGLYEFINNFEIDFSEFKDSLELPEIDVDDFYNNFFETDNDDPRKTSNVDPETREKQKLAKCPKCGYQFKAEKHPPKNTGQ